MPEEIARWTKAIVRSSQDADQGDQPKRTSADLVRQIAALNPMVWTKDDDGFEGDDLDIFDPQTIANWSGGKF